MLDHVFTDAIGSLRDALESALLERQAFEERFQTDVLLGDVTFETSYSLPGEGLPPRIRADIRLSWPTWSQTSYRSWYLEEEFKEAPRIDIDVTMRVQRLVDQPDPEAVIAVLPDRSTPVGTEELFRSGPTIEAAYPNDLRDPLYAVEVSYGGSYEVEESALVDGSALDEHFSAMGGWIAAVLVKLGDLRVTYHPPEG